MSSDWTASFRLLRSVPHSNPTSLGADAASENEAERVADEYVTAEAFPVTMTGEVPADALPFFSQATKHSRAAIINMYFFMIM